MSWREYARDAADTAIAFARVTASTIASTTKSLLLNVIATEDDDETGETQDEADVYGEAALLWRPADADSNGAPEVVVMRHGDERIVIATKDRRWQVELAKGDVCVRAMGADKPRLFLRADGTAVLEADTIKLGDSAATEAIALGTATKNYLTTLHSELEVLRAAYIAHNHPTAPVGPVSIPSVLVASAFTSPPDIESRHKVEN